MNRSVNILLLVISFPALFFTIYVSFDIKIFSAETVEQESLYIQYVFMGLGALLFLVVARRSVQRWVGVGMLRKPERFSWSAPIGKERKKQVRLFFMIEIVVAFAFTLVCYILTPQSWPLQIAYGVLFLDQLIFFFVANSWYRIGITDKALLVADREINVMYFSGLRRIEIHQQTIYFEYIEDLQLFFPANCVEEGDYVEFRTALESKLNRDKVFFSEKFKEK